MNDLADPRKRIVGTKEVLRMVREGRARTVYIAEDADEHIRQKILRACGEGTADVRMVPTMAELGAACHIEVGAAAACVTGERA
ncbi:MAG: 50S ribosomal protein L7Ae-like protein [Clostridiales bacterium]|nr:50S ribosomal protein L7Ae-like protein [Clostridiales bacterium]